MNSLFIKKKTSEVPYKVFKSVSDHPVRVMPFASSKLFVKFARQRRLSSAFEKSFVVLKFFLFSPSFSKARRSFTSFRFDQSLKNFSQSKHLSTSLFNGRSLSASRDFKISRISLRKLASSGLLPGVFKSSW